MSGDSGMWSSVARVGPPLSAALGIAALGTQVGPGATLWVLAIAGVSGALLPRRTVPVLSAWLVFNVLATPPLLAALIGQPQPTWPLESRYLLVACVAVAGLAAVAQGRVRRGS